MKADFFYRSIPGRSILKVCQKSGAFRVAAWALRTPPSRRLIPRYIKRNGIDMTPYEGQRYRSYAEFFARSKASAAIESDPEELISPCDGLVSAYPVTPELEIPMKGSHYHLTDLLPSPELAENFCGGLCLVFRLEASDYHHFCCFDDARLLARGFIPGQLHSVQPIACDRVPVYRLNRRWWCLLETRNFGYAAQIEVGAMLVGGVRFAGPEGWMRRGDEMGNFELAGSTVLLLLGPEVRRRLAFFPPFTEAMEGREVRTSMGERLGRLQDE